MTEDLIGLFLMGAVSWSIVGSLLLLEDLLQAIRRRKNDS